MRPTLPHSMPVLSLSPFAALPMPKHNQNMTGELLGDSASSSHAMALGCRLLQAGHSLPMDGHPALVAAVATHRCTPYRLPVEPQYE